MKPPAQLNAKLKKIWTETFENLDSESALDIDLAIRYCEWKQVYTEEKAHADKNGRTLAQKNGVIGRSPWYANQLDAESQMQRIYKLLCKMIADTDKDDGYFDGTS